MRSLDVWCSMDEVMLVQSVKIRQKRRIIALECRILSGNFFALDDFC
jgi:hypothetical protein